MGPSYQSFSKKCQLPAGTGIRQAGARLLLMFFFGLLLAGYQALPLANASWYQGDDLGYLDYVKVNGNLFEDLDSREIIFYAEDLVNGQVKITGILESEQDGLSPDDLKVQVSLDGGDTWRDAHGHSRWDFVFAPRLETYYDISIRVVKYDSGKEQLYRLGDFMLSSTASPVGDRLSGQAGLALGWLSAFIPEKFKHKGRDELALTVTGLRVDKDRITAGTVGFDRAFDLDINGTTLQISNISLTPAGASISGRLIPDPRLAALVPVKNFSNLPFTPSGIAHTLTLAAENDRPLTLDIISGTYGVGLSCSRLALGIDTAKELPVFLSDLEGAVVLGPGYGDVTIPGLSLINDTVLAFGRSAVNEASQAAALYLPGTGFSFSGLGGSIDLKNRSVSVTGSLNFPQALGNAQITIKDDTPLVFSARGISTTGAIELSPGTLSAALDIGGFPTQLTQFAMDIKDNIPSGELAGTLILSSFGNLPLDIKSGIDKTGLSNLGLALPLESPRTFSLAGFASLTLSRIGLSYTDGNFSADLDGSIQPDNDLVSSLEGMGRAIAFEGLEIASTGIRMAEDSGGWHDISGAAAQFEGVGVQLTQYGVGAENNLFWVGLRGNLAAAGATASATARIFHDGTTALEGLNLSGLSLALGEFTLRVDAAAVDARGMIDQARGTIAGLPAALVRGLPQGILNASGELPVTLEGLKVDLANRSVSLGAVAFTPASPLTLTLGPADLTLDGLRFTTSHADISGKMSLAALNLPLNDLPFDRLHIGRDGIRGSLDLTGLTGQRRIQVLEGEFGFGLDLSRLVVGVDSGRNLPLSLEAFEGGIFFGPGLGNLEIPDLRPTPDGAFAWGRQAGDHAGQSLARLTLPGGLFSMGNLGGSLDLGRKEISISGTLYLPRALGSASVTLPADRPLILSAAKGLSTNGPVTFDPGNLPPLQLSHMDTRLRELIIGIDHGDITGRLAADLAFDQFAGFTLPVSARIDKTGLAALEVDDLNLNRSVDLAGFARLSLASVSLGYEDDNFYVELTGGIAPTHPLLAEFTRIRETVDFSGLRIFKSGMALTDNRQGWYPITDASLTVNSARLALAEYGFGVKDGQLWFGVKGEAAFRENTFDLSAKIFQDGTTEVSDFSFEGLTLALGEFVLKTSANIENGLLSGEGLVDLGVLSHAVPGALKDPVTGAVMVFFENLAVDLDDKRVTSGQITLPFAQPLNLDLAVFSGRIRSVTLGVDGGSVDGDFSLKSLAGIDLPHPPENISFADMNFSPDGFSGIVQWNGGDSPLTLPILTGEYGIALQLSGFGLAVDTRAGSIKDRVRPTALEGAIALGPGYNMPDPLTDLRLMADQAIAWGSAQIQEQAQEQIQEQAQEVQGQIENAQNQLAQGLCFTIPGTEFKVGSLAGRLYLDRREMEVWGELALPGDFGGASLSLAKENALVLSARGVSTRGPVEFTSPGAPGFSLAGFGADLQGLSLGIADNTISGSIQADLRLDKFDNIPIAVAAAFSGTGIEQLSVAADRLERSVTIADFARIHLSTVSAGYENNDFFVTLDGSLTLDSPSIGDMGRSFEFKELKIYKDALALADASLGMHDIPNARISMGDALSLSLNQYGLGVEDNRFWIALAGGLILQGQEVTATARLYHDGEFVLDRMGADDLILAIGDFSLRTSFAFAKGEIEEAAAGLNLGAFMGAIPDRYKNTLGELPVKVRDLDIDLSDPASPKLVSGTVVFAPDQPVEIINDWFTARFDRIEVGAQAPYGKVVGGSISLTAGPVPGLENISVSQLGLTGSGLTGVLTWADESGRSLAVIEHDQYGIEAVLTRVSLEFNSAGTGMDEIIQLRDIGGHLSFGSGYGTGLTPAIALVEGAYAFAAGEAASLTLPGTAIQLAGFSGALDMAEGAVTLGGRIQLPYANTKIAFGVDKLVLSASGIAGAVALDSPVDLSGDMGFSALLTRAEIAFDGFSISSGGLGLDLTLDQFFNLKVAAGISLDSSGIKDWSIGGETEAVYTADAGFALMTVTDMGAGYTSEQGLYVSLDTDVEVKADAVLSGLPDDLNLSGIRVFNAGIDIDGAEMAKSFSGKTATLAGLDLTLTKLGIGYNEQFYLSAGGKLNIADLCRAGAELKLYSDLSFDLDSIEINVAKPAFAFDGFLSMAETESGWGFKAEVDVMVAGTLPVAGALELGSVYPGDDSPGYTYWRVAMKAGTVIPLSPVPLNIYGMGGGIAYHMSLDVDPATREASFTPDRGTTLALTAMLDLGSTDNGTAWFGKFALTMEPENFRVVLQGESWILEGRDASGQGQLSALIELGGSPAIFRVAAGLHLTKEVGGLDVVDVDGQVDLLFAENDWHIYFGSKKSPISATVLHFLGGQGYMQIDSQGLAMGVSKRFDMGGSAWIFYGRLYGGAEVDLEANIYPFYVDVRGRVWIGLEAGVSVGGSDYEIISAYAELGARFKAPPVYVGLHGKLHYSFLFGTIEGSWEMTFTYPEKPPQGIEDSGIEDMPLVSYALPEHQGQGIGRLEPLVIKTTMPLQEVFSYDDDYYILYLVDQNGNMVDFKGEEFNASNAALLKEQQSGIEYPLTGGLQSSTEIRLQPVAALAPGQTHFFVADFQLRTWDHATNTPGEVVRDEGVRHAFSTTTEPLSFRERVRQVYPTRNTHPVYRDTDIYFTSRAVMDGQQWTWAMKSENLSFRLVNGAGDVVPGRIEGSLLTTDDVQSSKQYMVRFIPEAPLDPVRMVEDRVTGIKRKAIKGADGEWGNPFLPDKPSAGSKAFFEKSIQKNYGRAGLRTPVASQGKTAKGKRTTAKSGKNTGLSKQARGLRPQADVYKWYWDGKFRIEITDGEGARQFVSGFDLALPPEGSDQTPYASTSQVIEQSVSDAHFTIWRNVSQDIFAQDVQNARRRLVYEPAVELFRTRYMGRAGQGGGCAPPAGPGALPAQVTDPVLASMNGWVRETWDELRNTGAYVQYHLFSAAMAGCREWEEAEAQWESAYEAYREESFVRHSIKDFKSIEFRFSTAAPVNWEEIQMEVAVSPSDGGAVTQMQLNGGYSAMGIPQIGRYYKTWGPDSYVVRSSPDGLHHVIELPAKKADFDGEGMLQAMYILNRKGIEVVSLGQVDFYERVIVGAADQAGSSTRTKGDLLFSTGPVSRVVIPPN